MVDFMCRSIALSGHFICNKVEEVVVILKSDPWLPPVSAMTTKQFFYVGCFTMTSWVMKDSCLHGWLLVAMVTNYIKWLYYLVMCTQDVDQYA